MKVVLRLPPSYELELSPVFSSMGLHSDIPHFSDVGHSITATSSSRHCASTETFIRRRGGEVGHNAIRTPNL